MDASMQEVMRDMMAGMGGMMGVGWMNAALWVNLLLGLGLLALVIIGIAGIQWLLSGAHSSQPNRGPDRSLEIVRERYARGEINRDEFERMHQDLS